MLNEEDIQKEDYEHAQAVWTGFNMKTMRGYHDVYFQGDVTQLANVMENFRDMMHGNFGLDPCHYPTAPAMSWDNMLKMTGVKLELISNLEMHEFVERGKRGGVSTITKRYAKANNKYMPSKYLRESR